MPLIFFLSTCLLLALPLSSSAQKSTVSIAPAVYLFKYQEYNQAGQLLDKEHGFLPGIRLEYEITERQGALAAYITFLNGTISYTGQTQSGTPHKTKTDEELINIGLKLIPRHTLNNPSGLFFGFQYWQWDRNIRTYNNVLGLHEVYSWQEIEAGLIFKKTSITPSTIWLELSALYTMNPNMEIILATGKYKLKQGQAPGFRIRTGRTWNENQKTSVSLNLLVEYWSFDRSNTIYVNDFFGRPAFITEPMSETVNTGLEFTFTHKF